MKRMTPQQMLHSQREPVQSRRRTQVNIKASESFLGRLFNFLAGGLFFEAHDTTTDVALTRRSLSNPALGEAGFKSTARLLSLFLGGFFVAWDPQKTAFICTQYTKEMNASPFPQNLCFATGNRPGLLRFVAEPPGPCIA